jgi:tetratricopeptide (TPR) repeat protein
VAKLLIFRGETKLDERELTDQTVRIGRAPQNDLILEDPGKGVSRNHAEIRVQAGRYVLVDLQSQNGIWVSGTRVPSIVLEPGVSAALGPFRLMVEAPPTPAVLPATDTRPELTQMSERAPSPLELDSLGPPPDRPTVSSTQPEEIPPKKLARTAPPPVRTVATDERPWYADPRILGGAAAVLLIAVSVVVGYKLMDKPAPPVWDAAAAQALVDGGKCQEALETQIEPALRADPENQQALALRAGCNPPPPAPIEIATSSIPPPQTVDERLNGAEALLAANVAADCQSGLETVNGVLAEDANNERAKALWAKANACINPRPTAPTVVAERPAVAVAPSQGGLELIQGETDKAYKARMTAIRKRYDDAVAVLASQKYVQAMKLLDDLVADVPTGYLELAQKRDEARSGIRAEAARLLESAQAAESRGDLATAFELYRRAHQLDQSRDVDAASQRIIAVVRRKCNEAQVEYTFGNTTGATAAYQDAVRVLPQNDPCSAKAKAMLQKLGK